MSLYQRVYRVLALSASAVAVVMAARTADSTWLLLFLALLPARKKKGKDGPMKLIKLSEVARRFDVSRMTIRRWLAAGHIRSVQVAPGCQHRFEEKEIERVLAARPRS